MGISSGVQPVYGPTNPSPEERHKTEVKRFGFIIGLVPGKEQCYRKLHSRTWPEVLKRLRNSHIRNYSIYTAKLEGKKYLFSYWEYTGTNYDTDMKAIADDPVTKLGWEECVPCQIPLPDRKPEEHWMETEMVFLME